MPKRKCPTPKTECTENAIFHLRVRYSDDSLLSIMESIQEIVDRARGDGEIDSAELEIGGNVYDV